jgi:hypothetical protein
MRRSSWLTLLSVVLFISLSGCKGGLGANAWCSVATRRRGGDDPVNLQSTLIFEEAREKLFVRMIECGEKSYYLGDKAFSSSDTAIEPGYRQSNLKWNGELSCSEVQTTFPPNGKETVDVLTELCATLTDEDEGTAQPTRRRPSQGGAEQSGAD